MPEPGSDAPPSRLWFPFLWLRRRRRDAKVNARFVRGDGRFLVLRDPVLSPGFYSVLLRFLADAFPAVRSKFELRVWPCRADPARYALLVPWLQDPVEAWSRRAHRFATRLEARFDAAGVPVVNRPSRLANAGKAEAALRLAAAGFRTPRMALVTDPAAFRETRLGLPLPLFVREDHGHGGAMLRADTDAEVRALDLSSFRRPVAVELLDVKSPDGLFRKRRTWVAGDAVVRQTLHVGASWCVRGGDTVYTEALRDEEIAWTSAPEPDPARWVAAREALGLEVVAFDHGELPSGETVVWEANPFPFLHVLEGRRAYRRAPTERVLAAMTRSYLRLAYLPVPPGMDALLDPARAAGEALPRA